MNLFLRVRACDSSFLRYYGDGPSIFRGETCAYSSTRVSVFLELHFSVYVFVQLYHPGYKHRFFFLFLFCFSCATFLLRCVLHFMFIAKRVQRSLSLINGANVEVLPQFFRLHPQILKLLTPSGFELTTLQPAVRGYHWTTGAVTANLNFN